MNIAGIIGGIGPESTIEYYRAIIAAYRQRKGDGGYPHLVVNSIDLKKLLDLIQAGQLSDVTELLLKEIHALKAAGASFGLLASNTPHIVFDDLRRQSPIPLISIVETACQGAQALGLKRVGLFGTRFTMQGRFYPEVFGKAGITLVVPAPDDQEYIHEIYMKELVNGIFLPETRSRLLSIVSLLQSRDNIDGLILGGTELPLILRDSSGLGIPFLDTTQLHVVRVVERLLS